VYFNVNFNVFFKLIKVHLLVSELYIYQNVRCNDKIKLSHCGLTGDLPRVLCTSNCLVHAEDAFGRFCLLCVVVLFWTLMSSLFWARLSTLCGFNGFFR
jgi:hypothetical protein